MNEVDYGMKVGK